MGEQAWERTATPAEIDAMCHLLDEALRHGGIGLSTTFMDTDRANREVPSRKADDVELGRLVDVVARHPGATLQFVPRFMQPEHWQGDFDRKASLCGPRDVRANWGALRCEQHRSDELGEGPGRMGCLHLHAGAHPHARAAAARPLRARAPRSDGAVAARCRDGPGGSWRYTRPAGGYRATIANGELTHCGGESTGTRPGRMVGLSPA